jgi:hypothetical protein
MTAEPNWIIVTIIGAVLGAIVARYGAAILWPIRRLKRHPIEGLWHSWHYTFHNDGEQLRSGEIRIRRGVLRPLVITANATSASGQKLGSTRSEYNGQIKVEANTIFLTLSAKNHDETVTMRFASRVSFDMPELHGLWMSYDFDLHPAAGIEILTRTRISEESALELISDITQRGDKSLRVKR